MDSSRKKNRDTSWEKVQKWYGDIVGESGHHYHKAVIMPRLKELLVQDKRDEMQVLDLACGNGVLVGYLPKNASYTGVDISSSLIKAAKKNFPEHQFFVGDVTQKLPTSDLYTHATIILAIQNIETPIDTFLEASKHLKDAGRLIIVMNHPCFRIPRQSSWGIDEENKIQYRRVDRYMTPLKIPIQAAPSKGEKSESTLSFHYSLTDYTNWLYEAGFKICAMEEWCSDKVSTGGRAKMENRAREEIPMFLCIIAEKG